MSALDLIAVAMSGGVDSSMAAALEVRRGAKVVGFTMQLWNRLRLPELRAENVPGRCCWLEDVAGARRVAEQLRIPHQVVNLEEEFEEAVVRPFVEAYLAGRTPIPCTPCNDVIKFERLLERARAAGAGRLATGHYARVEHDAVSGRYLLRRAVDEARDQTYFLFGLTQEQLARAEFPLGGLTKTKVRALARELELPVADKGDSQEICFVPGGDYAAFIEAYLREQGRPLGDLAGEIVTTQGRTLGEHGGYHRFTVGQRRGLNVAVGEPLYVIRTEPAARRVVVGNAGELLRDALTAVDVNWIAFPEPTAPVRAQVKIRHQHVPAPATLHPAADPSRVDVRFDEPRRAITPGQAAVFYDGDLVLGGGWIS